MSRTKRLLAAFLVLIALSCGFAVAQTPPLPGPGVEITKDLVKSAPPLIKFSDWKLVDQGEGNVEYLETFPSAFNSLYDVNNQVPLRILVPDPINGPVPVVLITHYWGATDLRAERALASDLNERGIAAAILTLPYHLARTPPGHRSGDLAIQPDPQSLRETMLQSVWDARRAMDFLNSRPEFVHDRFGLVGISLGALVSSLAYALDPRVKYATFVLGGVDLASIIWTSSRVVPQREQLRRHGWTEDRLRDALVPVEPLTYLPRTESGDTFVISAKYDSVVPHENSQELIDSLDHPKLLTIDTGHYGGIFVERKVLGEVANYFAQEMGGKDYVPPRRLIAPTLRIGGLAATPNDLDLGIGVDLLHLDPQGDRFGTLFATPRGLRLFFGQKIAQGLSFGVVGSTTRVGVGLLWSTVL